MNTATQNSTISTETKVLVAYEVLNLENTGKSKAKIAEEFGISPRSVTRYADQYETEAKEMLKIALSAEDRNGQKPENDGAVSEEAEEKVTSAKSEEASSEETETKETASETKKSTRKKKADATQCIGHRGRPPKGVKSIKGIVAEILEAHRDNGTLTKSNRNTIINEIAKKTGHNKANASKYFAGYKKSFGDYQDEPEQKAAS